nr:biotin-[acetyl-CoA-carboxylase] ligase [Cryptococcus depauperatus CBS 7855]
MTTSSATAHQVLVYGGPGVSPLSLSHTLLTLRLLLLPHYTVQPVTPDALSSQPWEKYCALLVFPGGRDLPFVEELTNKRQVTKRIKNYVEGGGKFLGICAGAYFASAELQFDVGGSMEVIGKRDLALFPGQCVGPIFEGFQYASEAGSHAVTLYLSPQSQILEHIYYNGGGHFILPCPATSDVQILAHFTEPSGSTKEPIAAVLTRNGKGCSVLTSVHPEYPLSDPPAKDAINKLADKPTSEQIEHSDKARVAWVENLLVSLGLHPPGIGNKEEIQIDVEEDLSLLLHPTHPSPIFFVSHPNLPQLPAAAIDKPSIKGKLKSNGKWKVLEDANDTIRFGPVGTTFEGSQASESGVTAWLAKCRRTQPTPEPSMESLSLEPSSTSLPLLPDFHKLVKTVLCLSGSSLPYSSRWTPLFNFSTYWTELDLARKKDGRRSGILRQGKNDLEERCSLGDCILYGETVTSTQTMLDCNPILLTNLPSPLVFLASFQLSGRGRGSNMWLSPPGCLQFSLLLDLPSFMSTKMVFIQYIMALAVCEAVDNDGKLGVRIKWPNDIYAQVEGVGGTEVGSGQVGRAKLGGILVNTNLVGGRWRIVVGCGINILNALPTTSLSQLHSLYTTRTSSASPQNLLPVALTMEGTFARIMSSFNAKWEQFIEEEGFEGFMDEYHGRWLHEGQEVTLTTTQPHTRVRILSITPDYGFLRCIPIISKSQSRENGLTPLFNGAVDVSDGDRGPWPSGRVGEMGNAKELKFVDLQPDGNSFDMMSGLIKRKA